MLGLDWSKGQARVSGGSSPNMTYHNGSILTSTEVKAIFWGTSWDPNSTADDKISGIDSWYTGVGGSFYAKTNDEYKAGTNQVTSAVSYLGHVVDTSAGPISAPSTATILNKVCSALTASGTTATPNGYYPVYVDLKRGSAGYCAWHSWGSCGGVPVQFAFFFNLTGDAGCDPADGSGLHSQGLAALANVTGHELSEAVTDPRGASWFDRQGAENGDKCAWAYGASLLTFSNGTQWKVQGNWSNQVYSGGGLGGYANRSGQKGCIDGSTQYPSVAP